MIVALWFVAGIAFELAVGLALGQLMRWRSTPRRSRLD